MLDGKTFVQVTAIVTPGTHAAVISESALRGLAGPALVRAK